MSSPSPTSPVRYVVISPARDEAQYIEKTIQSMLRQTVRPVQWIIVNDGSSDATAEIIERWASEEPWIMAVHRPDRSRRGQNTPVPSRGKRARQAKEIEAFYEGYQNLTATGWEYIVKLDADLGFDPEYFEKCFQQFDADPKLGVGGGVICHQADGALKVEPTPRFHVRGATKIYRRACWEQIGGMLRGAGWDTIDEVKANMLGWSTRSFDHLQVLHYRFTGAANGAWQNATKNGIWNYICGYHPLFMLLKCMKRLFAKPLDAFGLLYGFLLGYIEKVPQIDDKSVIRYLRAQQLRRLSFRHTIWQ